VIICAPIIFPIDSPPLLEGAVVIQKNKIIAVGKRSEVQNFTEDEIIDLPDTVLLPGFVNAHSHLELTSLRNLSYPGSFTDWIRKLLDLKPKISEEDYQKGIQQGISQMLQSGITTVGDHVSFNSDLTAILSSPLRGTLFVEVLGVVKEVAADILKAAENLEKLFEEDSKFRVIASPHSVHAVHPEILPKLFQATRSVLSIHSAESEEEQQLFRQHSGPLYKLIQKKVGAIRESPLHGSSLQHLNALDLLSNQIMAVHCNYINETDIDLLAKNKISVVHCPSSHKYFSHQKFPLEKLKQKKINLALGTDSLASGKSLSMLDQIRIAQKNYPEILMEEWLQIATLGGAKALKMENEVGSITPGKKADLIGFRISPSPLIPLPQGGEGGGEGVEKIFKVLLQKEKADFVMVDGKILFTPRVYSGLASFD